MIGSPQDSHLATHDLIPLDLLRNGLQCDLMRDVPLCDLGGGISRGRGSERVAGKEFGWLRGGMDGPVARVLALSAEI